MLELGRGGPTYPKGGQGEGTFGSVAMGYALGVGCSRLERGQVTTTGQDVPSRAKGY